jgi:2-C-methyl-D-erythritol 4-phosphate cytidylyltransferase
VPSPPAAVLGVVPVERDDASAPEGSAALRALRDVPLVRRAVGALVRSARVGRVLVPVAPGLVLPVEEALDGLAPHVEVLPVTRTGPGGQVLAALDAVVARPGPGPDVVVVHDPLHPLAPAALVDAVVDALAGTSGGGTRWGAAVPVRPVTDTLTWVDPDEVVTGHADREAFRMVYSPQAYRTGALHEGLRSAPRGALRAVGAEVLPGLVLARGARLRSVPAPGEVFRVATAQDLVLADAVLHVGGDPAPA